MYRGMYIIFVVKKGCVQEDSSDYKKKNVHRMYVFNLVFLKKKERAGQER